MDMTREAMEFIQELTEKAAPVHRPMEICGKTYVNERLIRVDEKPKAEPLTVSTLTGLMDYVTGCADDYNSFDGFDRKMVFHIEDPRTVSFFTTLDGERKRETLCRAKAEVNEFNFGRWIDQDTFIISLQSNFEANDDRDLVLKFSGNAMKQNEIAYADDGITQTATMKMGAASTANVKIPNPVTLRPFRTFQEVAQPETQYVFRMRDNDGLQFLLADASNGIWKNEAVYHIKTWIYDQLQKSGVSVAQYVVIG